MAKAYEAQLSADIAHHHARVEWLRDRGAKFSDGSLVAGRVDMLKASEDFLANPKGSPGRGACDCTPPCDMPKKEGGQCEN